MYLDFKHYYELTGGHEDDIILHKLFLKAGEYIGQGEESCIIGHGLDVLSVSLTPQDASKVEELQRISRVLEQIDPMETMFIRPRNIRLVEYKDLPADTAKVYSECIASSDNPTVLPTDTLLLTNSARASKVSNEFILTRINTLKRNLQRLHDHDWVHGDIHEGNIMQKGGDLVVIDWGKARPLTTESLEIENRLVEEMRVRLTNTQGKGKKRRSPQRSPGSLSGFFSPEKGQGRGLFSEMQSPPKQGLFGSPIGEGNLFASPARSPARASSARRSPARISPARGLPARVSPARVSPARGSPARPPPGSTGPYRRRIGLLAATRQSPARAPNPSEEGGV